MAKEVIVIHGEMYVLLSGADADEAVERIAQECVDNALKIIEKEKESNPEVCWKCCNDAGFMEGPCTCGEDNNGC